MGDGILDDPTRSGAFPRWFTDAEIMQHLPRNPETRCVCACVKYCWYKKMCALVRACAAPACLGASACSLRACTSFLLSEWVLLLVPPVELRCLGRSVVCAAIQRVCSQNVR